jgi:hypothetical protein
MGTACKDCARLWRDYTKATLQSSRLDAGAHLARLRGAYRAVNALFFLLRISERNEARLRQRIVEHHSCAHNVPVGISRSRRY